MVIVLRVEGGDCGEDELGGEGVSQISAKPKKKVQSQVVAVASFPPQLMAKSPPTASYRPACKQWPRSSQLWRTDQPNKVDRALSSVNSSWLYSSCTFCPKDCNYFSVSLLFVTCQCSASAVPVSISPQTDLSWDRFGRHGCLTFVQSHHGTLFNF